MILEQHGDRISRCYVTWLGDDEVAGSKHPLVGLAAGAAIGSVVAWPAADSVTSWAGRLETDATGNAALYSVWHLVRRVSGNPSRELDVWESFLTDSPAFRKDTGES
jgi:Avidin family